MTRARPIAGIVLAAGRSTRFGASDKLLAPFDGRPLAAHAACAMRAAAVDRRIAVVTSAEVATLFDGFDIVEPVGAREMSDSLRAGVGQAIRLGAAAVVVTLADMPLVDADLLDRVADVALRRGAAAATDGQRRSPPAAFRALHFKALLEATGDTGAAPILRSLPPRSLIAVPDILFDVDRPVDLALLSPSPPRR